MCCSKAALFPWNNESRSREQGRRFRSRAGLVLLFLGPPDRTGGTASTAPNHPGPLIFPVWPWAAQRHWLLSTGGSTPSSCAGSHGKGHFGSGLSECCHSWRGGGPSSSGGAGCSFGASSVLPTPSCLGRTEGWCCMDQHRLCSFPHPFWIPGGVSSAAASGEQAAAIPWGHCQRWHCWLLAESRGMK